MLDFNFLELSVKLNALNRAMLGAGFRYDHTELTMPDTKVFYRSTDVKGNPIVQFARLHDIIYQNFDYFMTKGITNAVMNARETRYFQSKSKEPGKRLYLDLDTAIRIFNSMNANVLMSEYEDSPYIQKNAELVVHNSIFCRYFAGQLKYGDLIPFCKGATFRVQDVKPYDISLMIVTFQVVRPPEDSIFLATDCIVKSYIDDKAKFVVINR